MTDRDRIYELVRIIASYAAGDSSNTLGMVVRGQEFASGRFELMAVASAPDGWPERHSHHVLIGFENKAQYDKARVQIDEDVRRKAAFGLLEKMLFPKES